MEQEGKSTLLHLIRRFTIIDFLGYLIPGSIITLSWNYRFNGILKAPFQDFFGEQTVLLTLYFLVLSYLVGTVIHEISKPLDLLVNKMLYRPLKEREALGNTKLYYKQIFPSPLRTGQESSGSVPRSSAASETTGNQIDFEKIYHWIQPRLDDTKVPLFQAFSTLSRTGAVTILIVALLYWTDPSRQPFKFCTSFFLQVFLVIALMLLLIGRCYRFKKTSMKYIYDYFDFICIEKQIDPTHSLHKKKQATADSEKAVR